MRNADRPGALHEPIVVLLPEVPAETAQNVLVSALTLCTVYWRYWAVFEAKEEWA